MELLIVLGVALIGFVAVVIAGLPVMQRVVDHRLTRHHEPYIEPHRARFISGTTIEPIDFGPDPVKWPSEVRSDRPTRPELQWPSTQWDDDHFGGSSATEAAETARRKAEKAAFEARKASRAQVSPSGATAKRRVDAGGTSRAPARPAPQRKRKVTLKPRKTAPASGESPPASGAASEAAEVQQMLAEQGLAQTVRTLQQQTGWSLERITAFLASLPRV